MNDDPDGMHEALRELVSRWQKQRDERRELADGMFMDGNKAYQQGYADAMDGCAGELEKARTLPARNPRNPAGQDGTGRDTSAT